MGRGIDEWSAQPGVIVRPRRHSILTPLELNPRER
jgi:hypothetical protein